MADATYYVALPFVLEDSNVSAGEGVECPTASSAIMRAEIMSRIGGHIGAIAISRTVDSSLGRVLDVTILRRYGQVPDDLSGSKYFKGARSKP